MKLSCKVIKDLLPLYHDGVCSDESRDLVDAHLRECGSCRDVLQSLKEEIVSQEEVDAAKPLKAVQEAWKRVQWKAMGKGAAIGLLACAVLVAAFWALTQWYCVPMPTEDLSVVEVAQLDDGWIYCKLGGRGQDSFGWFEHTLTEDGILYFTPMKPLVLLDREWSYAKLQINPDEGHVFPLNQIEGEITAYYLGTPEDAVLIWEKGMELPVVTAAEVYGSE